MLEIKRTSGLIINKSDAALCQRIKNDLTITNRDFNDNIITNYYYVESENIIKVPRYFPIQNLVPGCVINDESMEGETIDINHNIVPRTESQKITINHMMNNDNSVIQLEPGAGKTVITIFVISERKKKSLILVHRESLADQWRDRFVSFTDLKNEDIALLTSKKFEENLKAPIVISTVQTFLSLLTRKREEFLIALNKANFGIFVGDECHVVNGAPTFSEASIHVPTKVNFGLSATPSRKDGSDKVIRYHLGEVFTDLSSEGTMSAKVIIAGCDFGIDIPKRKGWLYWQGKFQRSRYLNFVEKSILFDLVIRQIMSKIEADNRHSLIVCERISLLDKLFTYLKSEDKKMFISGDKNINLEAQFVFSTPGKIRDGVDAPWKDTLIMTSPISNIAQICGRIVRLHENKLTPVIFDIVDTGCKLIANTCKKRIEYYEEKKWEIIYVIVDDSGKRTVSKGEFQQKVIR